MEKPEPLVSVIIVNYNGKKYLKNCFDSLKNGEYANLEIIFVDNGSKDGSIELVKKEYTWIKIIDNQKNLGLAIASNKGAEISKGKYLFFLNNDTISQPNILTELVAVMEDDPAVGVCACKNMTYDGKQELSTGLSCDIFGFPCANDGEIFYADAGIFIRKSVFEEIGGFDNKLFLYGEDRDICWRVLLQGYNIAGVPSAIFYHDSACTFTGKNKYTTNIWRRYWGEYNLIRSMLKNYSAKTLLIIFPCFLILSFFEVIFLLSRGEIKVVFYAYIKSYWQNILDLPDTLRERSYVQRIRKVNDSFVQKRMVKGSGKIRIYKRLGVPKFDNKRIFKS
jgi:GT2 family glycosyltransferase